MKKYWFVFKGSLQLSLTYRGEIIFRALRHTILLIMFLSLWNIVFKSSSSLSGFNFRSITTYYILVEVVDMIYTARPAKRLAQQIKNGDLNNFLIKPLNYWWHSFFYILGNQLGTSSLSIVLATLFFIFFPQFVAFPNSPITLLLLLISLVLAWILNFQIFFLLGIASFWFSEVNYIRIGGQQLINILAGRWVPLALFSPAISAVLLILPFQYLYNFLAGLYLGKYSGREIVTAQSVEMIWIFGLVVIGNILWKRGLKHFEAYGQ